MKGNGMVLVDTSVWLDKKLRQASSKWGIAY
jgi:hypothetical protein